MSLMIDDSGDFYLSPGKEVSYVLSSFSSEDRMSFDTESFFSGREGFVVKEMVRKNVRKNGYFYTDYEGGEGGKVLFKIIPNVYRGPIEIEEAVLDTKGLESFLKPTTNFDFETESVAKASKKICSSLSGSEKLNPLIVSDRIVDWIQDNIEYCSVPKSSVEHVAGWIETLSSKQKRDPFTILNTSYNIRSDILKKVARHIRLPNNVTDDFEIAKFVMNKAGNIGGVFKFFWLGEEMTASRTLESGMGKCTGQARLFVALARSLGIPCQNAGGYLGGFDGGNHAWANIFAQPYGWVEFDPTNGEIKECDRKYYGYKFFKERESYPKLSLIERENSSNQDLEEIIELLENNQGILYKILGRKKHAKEIEFLQGLK
ncbi:MAG: transglutaminase domain-containing protein [Nanoarchaeota archaeon]|nr:transglutaminase domain-containing protein [Nanoarchaeota archaeon]